MTVLYQKTASKAAGKYKKKAGILTMLDDYLRYNLRSSDKTIAREPAPAVRPGPKTRAEVFMEMADIGAQLADDESFDPYNRCTESYLRKHPRHQ